MYFGTKMTMLQTITHSIVEHKHYKRYSIFQRSKFYTFLIKNELIDNNNRKSCLFV